MSFIIAAFRNVPPSNCPSPAAAIGLFDCSIIRLISDLNLYSNLTFLATRLPVIYGKPVLFEPLFLH